jgi:hypothetical protein
MRPMRPLVCLLLLLAATSSQASLADAPPAAPVASEPDPWATMRGCVVVLERFASCASDEAMRGLKPRWLTLADPGKKVDAKEIQAMVHSWAKPDERRRQCAIWTKRDGAPAHVGEGAPLAKLAAEKSTTCVRFAREISDDGWVPKAIVDTLARPVAGPSPK